MVWHPSTELDARMDTAMCLSDGYSIGYPRSGTSVSFNISN